MWCLADGERDPGKEEKEEGSDEGKETEDVDVAIKSDGDHECSFFFLGGHDFQCFY